MSFKEFKWKCREQGCFNDLKRPDFGHYYDSLPGTCSMTDIDAMTEINDFFLFLEFKSGGEQMGLGQAMAFTKLTLLSPRVTFIVVQVGKNPEDILSINVIRNGKMEGEEKCDLYLLKERIAKWSAMAKGKPKKKPRREGATGA